MPLKDVPPGLKASRVIVAVPRWRDASKFEAAYMVQDDFYNGVNFVKSDWDCLVSEAIVRHTKRLSDATPEYAAKSRTQGDWLAVTVDYHS